MLPAEVHLVESWRDEVLEMRRVLGDLLLVLLSRDHVDTPSHVKLRNQMNALRVVHSMLLPALDKLVFELLGLLRENIRSLLEIATNEFLIDNALRRVPH